MPATIREYRDEDAEAMLDIARECRSMISSIPLDRVPASGGDFLRASRRTHPGYSLSNCRA